MKKTIRRSCYETNSSSSHSISISNTPTKETFPNFRGKDFELLGGEFGWGPDNYTDWQIKANYAAVAIKKNNLVEHEEWLVEALKEKLNCDNVVFNIDLDSYSSYIDHQSDSVFQDSVESKTDLYNFIFNDSELVIDNDNG